MACDKPGCFRAHPNCAFGGNRREQHRDSAGGRHAIPRHQDQVQLQWQGHRHVSVDGTPLHMGSASGVRNNCLIDSLRQVLQCPGDASVCASVREMLRLEFRDPRQVDFVGPENFLTLDLHWQAVVRHLAALAVLVNASASA